MGVSRVPRRKKHRPEGYRWLRSGGTPSFTNRIYKKPSELYYLAKRNVVTATPMMPVGIVARIMDRSNRRILPVVDSNNVVKGMISVMDMVNYLGGGELFGIVENRYKKNIYWALGEPARSIMSYPPITVQVNKTLENVIEKMIIDGVGAVPIVTEKGVLFGIISERDVVGHIAEKDVGVKVKEVMTTSVITVNVEESLKNTMEKMVKYGFRRLPVTFDHSVWGIIRALDIVKFFGSNTVFNYVVNGSIDEPLKVKIGEIALKEYYTIHPDADVGEAAGLMSEKNTGVLLVVENSVLKGIVTARDILMALALEG